MEEIKAGEYVRTIEGYIAKCINSDKYVWEFDNTIRISYWEPWKYLLPEDTEDTNHIKSHSFNIIDLVEAGDYVNGMEVEEFDDEEGNLYLGFSIYTDALMDCIEEVRPLDTIEIKSIVTKEQFESMKYVLGE